MQLPAAGRSSSRGSPVDRALSLVPGIASRATADRVHRRLSAETMTTLRNEGLFRLLQPRRWGGEEVHPRVFFDVQMALARGDMSAAWVQGTLGMLAGQVGLFDDRAARDIWGDDPDALICSSLAPSGSAVQVAEGYELTGHWKYASGADFGRWALLAALVDRTPGDRPEGRMFLLPRPDFAVVDSWHTNAMQATGSHDIHVDRAFVPSWRTHSILDNFRCTGPGQASNPGPLYRVPYFQLFFRSTSCPAIGALETLHSRVAANVRPKVGVFGRPIAKDPATLQTIAEVSAAIDEMKILVHHSLDNLMDCAVRAEETPLSLRTQYKYQSATVADRCATLAVSLLQLTGTGGLSDQTGIGPIVADILAGRQHFANQVDLHARSFGNLIMNGEAPGDIVM